MNFNIIVVVKNAIIVTMDISAIILTVMCKKCTEYAVLVNCERL
jgi:hypothetical protein